MADVVIQRVVFPLDLGVAPLYYQLSGDPRATKCGSCPPRDRRSIGLAQGARLVTNTYFNSFFETYWRRHTILDRLILRLHLSGTGTVRVLRTCGGHDSSTEVARADFHGQDVLVDIEIPSPPAQCQKSGTLFFELTAQSRSVLLVVADWMAMDVAARRTELVAGYCTFNREKFLLGNIRRLCEDADLSGYLTRILVVDQGTRKVADHPDYRGLPPQAFSRTSWFDQANFGGAGGFTRCILEAVRRRGATHMLLLDDDAAIEPESVFRTATFFSLAKEEFAVGGAMFDLLRPREMYEMGGTVAPSKIDLQRRVRNLSLGDPQNVQALAEVEYPHYNAWWFFAFPLALVARVGLPLPLFLKCDDVEFGARLMRAGIPTVTLPGLGVWHQPFYAKDGGWEEGYYWRNILAVLALHFPVSRISLACTLLARLLSRLLTFEYFKAWALCQGVGEFLSGPAALKSAPHRRHERILEVHRRLSSERIAKTRRHRGRFVQLLFCGLWRILCLLLEHGRAAGKWQRDSKQLTETQFWYTHLGLTDNETPGSVWPPLCGNGCDRHTLRADDRCIEATKAA